MPHRPPQNFLEGAGDFLFGTGDTMWPGLYPLLYGAGINIGGEENYATRRDREEREWLEQATRGLPSRSPQAEAPVRSSPLEEGMMRMLQAVGFPEQDTQPFSTEEHEIARMFGVPLPEGAGGPSKRTSTLGNAIMAIGGGAGGPMGALGALAAIPAQTDPETANYQAQQAAEQARQEAEAAASLARLQEEHKERMRPMNSIMAQLEQGPPEVPMPDVPNLPPPPVGISQPPNLPGHMAQLNPLGGALSELPEPTRPAQHASPLSQLLGQMSGRLPQPQMRRNVGPRRYW